jgi:hypothetical protein
MTTYYVLGSPSNGSHTPIGKVHASRLTAEEAARALNEFLPRLHVQVLEVSPDNIDQQPPDIRQRVEEYLQGHSH